jgi:hypothetical protein
MTSNDYARLAVKANSTLNYGGFNVYANGNNNFIALTHDNNVGWVTTEFASGGTGFTPLAFATGGAERMRITSGGEIYMGTSTTDKNSRLVLYGNSTTSGSHTLRCFSSGSDILFQVRNDGLFQTGTASGSPYNNTSGTVGNVVVNSSGTLERSTVSSLRFKENIKDWDGNGLDTILALKPKTFKYKKDYYNKADIDFLGLIAEEVAEVSPYLADFENEDRTGQVENVRYAYLVVPLIKAMQEQQDLINELSAKVSALENKS